MNRDWKEAWIDRMGLIVALSGTQRFEMLDAFKLEMLVRLSLQEQAELRAALRQRFTPSGGTDGCQGAMEAVYAT